MHPVDWKEMADTWARLSAPLPVRRREDGPKFDSDRARDYDAMTRWLWANADVTLAALRPRCPSCGGALRVNYEHLTTKTQRTTEAVVSVTYVTPGPCHCVNTDHPGWAA